MDNKKVKISIIVSISIIIMGVIIYGINLGNVSKASKEDNTVVHILHTNDMHADIENLSYVSRYKKEVKNSILVDVGDSVQGKSLATYTKGSAIIELMNKVGYDVSAIGNHDFDYGLEQLLSNINMAKFPFVASNIKNEKGENIFAGKENNGEYAIIEKVGKKIGFFGITTTETAYKTNPENVKGIVFDNELLVAQELADKLNGLNCDLVVGLTHVGIANNKLTSMDIANTLTGVDVIIDGHSHTEIQKKASNGTYLVQTGSKLNKIGQISIEFSLDDIKIETKLIKKDDYKIYGKDEAVDQLYKEKMNELERALGQVIGRTNSDLTITKVYKGGKKVSVVKNRETSMGDIIGDSMIWGAKNLIKNTSYDKLPVVALMNGGGIKANIKAGDITIGDVYNVLPFGTSLSVKVITPNVLYNTLEYSISGLKLDEVKKRVLGAVGSYPQISGMRFEMDLKQEAYKEGVSNGKRIVSIYIKDEKGEEVLLDRKDDKMKILFASNDFLAAGGDGFTMLKPLENVSEGSVLDEIFAEYIKKLTKEEGGVFSYEKEGNRSIEINLKK